MESNAGKEKKWKQVARIALVACATLAIVIIQVQNKNSALAEDEGSQTTFGSPSEAGTALAQAAKNGDDAAVAEILGMQTKTLLGTGDKGADKAALAAFASKYMKMNRWVNMNDGTEVLYIGADNFAFPVPLARNSDGEWYFDAVAGAEEVRARNIGRNELLTIDACSGLAAAQQLYFASGGDSQEYAQRLISTSGKQDGLYWPASQTQSESPLAGLSELPRSSLASLAPDQPLTMDGYTFRILTAQGDDAPGGAKSYIVNGKMTGGFAILAAPVKYAQTGIMTFICGSDGVVYERDLGPDTAKITASIQDFNPTDDWTELD
jgi:Protein of unknown function (DUF2950)